MVFVWKNKLKRLGVNCLVAYRKSTRMQIWDSQGVVYHRPVIRAQSICYSIREVRSGGGGGGGGSIRVEEGKGRDIAQSG